MNGKIVLLCVAMMLAFVSFSEAHKKYYTQPIHEQHGPCICDCGPRGPILPNKPFYGSGGYAQRPSYGGGSAAVAGGYGGGAAAVSGNY